MSLAVVAAVKWPNSLIFGSEKRSLPANMARTDIASESKRKIHRVNDLVAFTRVGHGADLSDVIGDVRIKCRGKDVFKTARTLEKAIMDKYTSTSLGSDFAHYLIQKTDLSCTHREKYKINSGTIDVSKDGTKLHIKVEYTVGDETKTIDRDLYPGEIGELIIGGYDDKRSKNPAPRRFGVFLPGKTEAVPTFNEFGCGIFATGMTETYTRLIFGFDPDTKFDTRKKQYRTLKRPRVIEHIIKTLRFKFDWERITQEQMIAYIEHLIKLSELMENMGVSNNGRPAGLNSKVEIATIDPLNGFLWIETHDESLTERIQQAFSRFGARGKDLKARFRGLYKK